MNFLCDFVCNFLWIILWELLTTMNGWNILILRLETMAGKRTYRLCGEGKSCISYGKKLSIKDPQLRAKWSKPPRIFENETLISWDYNFITITFYKLINYIYREPWLFIINKLQQLAFFHLLGGLGFFHRVWFNILLELFTKSYIKTIMVHFLIIISCFLRTKH